jgi:hypothetical protein
MHEPKGGVPRPISGFSESQELTAIDPIPPGVKQAPSMPLVVEGGKKRVGDDDPTLMMVREHEGKGQQGAPTVKGSGPQKPPAPKDTIEDKLDTKAKAEATVKSRATSQKKGMPLPLMILIAVVLLAGAAAIGLYFGGIIG